MRPHPQPARGIVPALATALATVLAVVMTVLMSASPANALYVRPAKALLLNAAGVANGCEAKANEFIVTPFHQRIESTLRLVCPEEAAVRRISIQHGVWEVLDDGTLREVVPYARSWRTGSAAPLVGTFRFPTAITSCVAGETHTWLIRVRVSVKKTSDNSDPDPFEAKVDRSMSVTCP